MSLRHLLILCAVLTATLLLPDAQAQDKASERGLVLESHIGPRPRDAGHLLDPLLDELKLAGFRGSSVTGTRIHAEHSISSQKLNKTDEEKARRFIKEGHASYLDSRFSGAVDSSEAGLRILLSRPATMATQQQVRTLMYEALVTISMASYRLGNTEALREAMSEYVRSFPDKEVSRRDYGPEGTSLYHKIVNEMNEQQRGELQIAAGKGAMIFINERYVGIGSFKIKLYPGRYRIYTQSGAKAGRVHLVDIAEGGKKTLVVDDLLDKALHTDSNFVGFSFPDEATRTKHERRLAVALGRALGAKKIILVGLHTTKERTHIVASAIAVETDERGASAQILIPNDGAPSAQRLRELARYVAGAGPAGPDIEVLINSQNDMNIVKQSKSNTERSPLSPVWRYASWGLGVVGLGAGAYLISIDGTGTCDLQPNQVQCPKNHQTLGQGIGSLAAGAAFGLVGVYFWSLEGDEKKPALSVIPTEGGLSASFSGRF